MTLKITPEQDEAHALNTHETTQYSFIAKLFHWGFVLVFIYGVIKQVGNLSDLEDSALLKFEVIFAGVFIVLLAIRFIYMSKTQTSSLPANSPKIHTFAAKLVHYGLYAALALIAVSGLMIGFLFWLGLKSGLVIEAILSLHEFSMSLTYGLIVIHIAAAVYHRLLKDGVWSSMVPFWNNENK